MKKIIMAGIFLLIFAAVALGFGYAYWQNYINSPLMLQKEQVFTLSPGTNRIKLAESLQQQKIIENTTALPWIIRFDPQFRHIKAGTYLIKPAMTVKELLALFVSGKEMQLSIQFIEGTRLKDWMNTLNNAPYLKHTITDSSENGIAALFQLAEYPHAEGWFYPDSYQYTANMRDIDILKRAHQKMQTELTLAWQSRDDHLPYKTPYELLIMASIIEKETGVDSERALVASVFTNRLKKGMRLQTDPTVIYGMGERYQGNIRRKDLQEQTIYNTYMIDGLPPTPIAMPSRASLQAAAHPANSPYLYFVADGKGGHTFSTDLNGHNRAVQEYLRILRSQKSR